MCTKKGETTPYIHTKCCCHAKWLLIFISLQPYKSSPVPTRFHNHNNKRNSSAVCSVWTEMDSNFMVIQRHNAAEISRWLN